MTTTIDQRVVEMQFKNGQFAAGIKSTMDQLAAFKNSLKLDGATKGLEDINTAANKFSLAGMQQQVSGILGHFSALQLAAITAFTTIAHKAVEAGTAMAKSFTVQPLIEGLREYETNLGSIQTILANTGLKGSEGLRKVNEALDELNHYSDQTIYNFSEMARNIGTFTAAGVDLDVSTDAIKGIANLAAISGSNAQQASTAMYQLSQALATGRVSLMDWNSVVNAGMGGEVFQNALMETARVHGIAVDSLVKKNGSFRDSLQEGWLTTEVLTETLSKFTGELTADQLKSMGYTEQQIAGIIEMGKTAVAAATEVKTMSQLLGTLREAAGSGWAKTWQLVFGDFEEAKELFSGAYEVLGGMIQRSAEARNTMLQGWKDLGGRDVLIQGIGNAFNALLSVLKPIRDAFRDIFPATTAKQLYDMTVRFRDFMANLKLGEDTANNLRRTFAGFFAILGIGWELLKAGIGFISDLVGKLTDGTGGFLNFTGSIGDFLVGLHQAIKDGQGFVKFFEMVGRVLDVPIMMIRALGTLLGSLFKGVDTGSMGESIGSLKTALEPLGRLGEMIASVWSKVVKIFDNVVAVFAPLAQQMGDWFSSIGEFFSNAFGEIDYGDVLAGVQTGLLGGLLLILRKLTKSIGDFDISGGFFQSVVGAIDQLTGTLKGMQNALNATALLLIAAAIGILTLSIVALASIDSAGLTRASVAIAVMFTQLGLAFMAFSKMSTGASAIKVGVMAAGLILLATAVRVLASAVAKLAGIPMDELRRGLIATAVLIGVLVAASNRLDTNTAGMIRTSAGLVVLALAIRVLVNSVKELSTLDWNELAKGLTGVAVLLASLALFTRLSEVNKGGIAQGAGLILLATALKILASAVGDFAQYNWEELAQGMAGIAVGLGLISAAINLIPAGAVLKAASITIVAASLNLIADAVQNMSGMRWDEIARGMTVMAGALLSIALALKLMPKSSLLNAASILVVAASLQLIQQALGNMSGMSWEEIAKGLVVLAGSLVIIAAAVRVMTGALSGAAAILVVSAALRVLLPVLTTLGDMSWESIAKGIAGLAAVFIIFGVAGLVLAPLVPVLAGLAGSIALLGLAVMLAGAGVFLFATGLTALAAAGAGATVAIVAIVSGLIGLIPLVMEQIGLGLIAFAKVIATAGPSIVEAITTVLLSFLEAIRNATPAIVDTLLEMLQKLLDALADAIPRMTEAGFKILIGFLKGIANNIGRVVDEAVRIITNFIDGIARNLPRIIQSAVDLILAFVNGLAEGIRKNSTKIADAGWNLASALVEGVIKGLGQLAYRAVDAAVGLAKSVWNAAMDFLGIASPSKKFMYVGQQSVIGLAVALVKYAHIASDAAANAGHKVVDAMGRALGKLDSLVKDDILDLHPTITPVLDLTDMRKDAKAFDKLFPPPPPFAPMATYSNARAASKGYEENRQEESRDDSQGSGDTYVYNQTNNSPKALSSAEVYRKTSNLISRTKKEAVSVN